MGKNDDFCKETKTKEEIEECTIDIGIECDGCKFNGCGDGGTFVCTNIESCQYGIWINKIKHGCCKFEF